MVEVVIGNRNKRHAGSSDSASHTLWRRRTGRLGWRTTSLGQRLCARGSAAGGRSRASLSGRLSAARICDPVPAIPLDGLLHSLAIGHDTRIANVCRPWVDDVGHHVGIDGVTGAKSYRLLSIEILRTCRCLHRTDDNEKQPDALHANLMSAQ